MISGKPRGFTLQHKIIKLEKKQYNSPQDTYEQRHEISNNVVCATSKGSDQCSQSLCKSFEYSMTVKLLTEQHLKFLSFKIGCTGSSESTSSHVKIPHCWKSHVVAQLLKIAVPRINFKKKVKLFSALPFSQNSVLSLH